MEDDITARFLVGAQEVKDGELRRTLYRHEEWPCMVREGEWMDIHGNDEEVTSIRYRRLKDGTKFVLVDIEILSGSFDNLHEKDGWCDSAEVALSKEPS